MPKTDAHSQNFLDRLPSAERAALGAISLVRDVARGDFVFKAGGDGELCTHFLQQGRIKVYYLSPGGKEVVLWFCEPGEIFGLAEVCGAGGRQVYAEACEDSRVAGVRQEDFRRFLERHPSASLLVNEILARRLRELGQVIQGLVTSDVPARVAQLVLRLAGRHGCASPCGAVEVDIRLTHQEMANMVGASRQTVTTILNDFKRHGWLLFERRRLKVLSETGLRSLIQPGATGA